VLVAALQGCRSLTHFDLREYDLFLHEHFGALLNALAALPLLQELDLRRNTGLTLDAQRAAAGRALGALLAANPPCLHTLDVRDCLLGDFGLGLLLDGLAANTHLRTLHCYDNDLSEAFERARLEPAQRELAARRANE
jgi:Leucine-rich repeat (LRR) protein